MMAENQQVVTKFCFNSAILSAIAMSSGDMDVEEKSTAHIASETDMRIITPKPPSNFNPLPSVDLMKREEFRGHNGIHC